MPSFYKSNLIQGHHDSLLIQAEKVINKEKIIGGSDDANVEANFTGENKKEEQTLPISYPYSCIVFTAIFLIMLLKIIVCIYMIYLLIPVDFDRFDRFGNIIPHKFFEPCDYQHLISLDEVQKIKNEMLAVDSAKNSIKFVAEYNISTYTNQILTEKFKNLTETSIHLNEQFQYQKDARYSCFKENLIKRCETKTLIAFYNTCPAFFHIYAIIISILTLIALFLILKSGKCELSHGQKKSRFADLTMFVFIIVINIGFVTGAFIEKHFFPFNAQYDLQKFSF